MIARRHVTQEETHPAMLLGLHRSLLSGGVAAYPTCTSSML
jgi:hypothetical protein